MENWIAVYTKPRHEKVVRDQLEQRGIATYLPLVRQKRKWSDRWKWVDMPLFKSYLFARIELKNCLYVLQTVGVHHIVKFNKKIATVPQSQIDNVRLVLEGGYNPEPVDYLVVGDEVEVAGGPLRGVRGIVARFSGEERLVLKIDAIQQGIAVHIDRRDLKAVRKRVPPVS